LDGAKYLPTSSSHVVGFQADRAAKGVDATGDKKTAEESSNDAQENMENLIVARSSD